MVHTDSCVQVLNLRPSHHHGSTFIRNNGHPLDNLATLTSPSRCSDRSSSKSSSRKSSKNDEEKNQLVGPERFFYDRSTYTGVHRHGGPATRGMAGFPLQLRPSMHLGSSFTCNSGHPLDHDSVLSLGAGTGTVDFQQSLRARGQLEHAVYSARQGESIAGRSSSTPRRGEQSKTGRASSLGAMSHFSSQAKENIRACSNRQCSKDATCEITEPERFFYDKCSYTGVHKYGGPDILDGGDVRAMSMRSRLH